MATKKTPIPIMNIVLFLGIIIIVVLVIKKFTTPKVIEDEFTPGTTTSSSSSSSSAPVSAPTAVSSSGLPILGNGALLKKGTKAAEVKYVQSYYNDKFATPLGKTLLVKDGIFGSNTETAVKLVTGSTTTTWTAFKQKLDSSLLAGYAQEQMSWLSGIFD